MDIENTIEAELRYFDSEEQRQAFRAARVSPKPHTQSWQYGPEEHSCIVVATDGKNQIVYCATGFGPEFPWSVQAVGERDLGMDSQWHAYLYESFVCSTMWAPGAPSEFMHMARGER